MVWGVGQASRLSQDDADAGQARRLSCSLAAGLFAVHPIVTEAVCEPTFREDLLVAACTLGTLSLAVGGGTVAALAFLAA